MDYHTWKLYKKRVVAVLCLVSAALIGLSICLIHWARLTLPKHPYKPKIGDYVGPKNLSGVYLGIFGTSHGPYTSLFSPIRGEEVRKVNIVASMLLGSVCSMVAAAGFKVLAPVHCRPAKRYKAPALLCVLAVVLNVGALVLWFWFTYGFTHGKYTLGAELDFSYSVYVMLSSCGVLIIIIGLEFISCKRRRRDEAELVISQTPSELSDSAPLNISPDSEDLDISPPPYQDP